MFILTSISNYYYSAYTLLHHQTRESATRNKRENECESCHNSGDNSGSIRSITAAGCEARMLPRLEQVLTRLSYDDHSLSYGRMVHTRIDLERGGTFAGEDEGALLDSGSLKVSQILCRQIVGSEVQDSANECVETYLRPALFLSNSTPYPSRSALAGGAGGFKGFMT